jgi:hypothetical protein
MQEEDRKEGYGQVCFLPTVAIHDAAHWENAI